MAYAGDTPSNPVALSFTSDVATAVVTAALDVDVPAMWFSIAPLGSNTHAMLITNDGSVPRIDSDICIIWDGATTAHYPHTSTLEWVDETPARELAPYRELPAGETILIGILPRSRQKPPEARYYGEDSGGASRALSYWNSFFATDYGHRLPADFSLEVTLGDYPGGIVPAVTPTTEGSAANPKVMDFTSSQDPQTFSYYVWSHANLHIAVTTPAGYGITVSGAMHGVSSTTPEAFTESVNGVQVYYPAAGVETIFKMAGNNPFDSFGPGLSSVTFTPVVKSSVSGPLTGQDDNPCQGQVAIYRLEDHVRTCYVGSSHTFSVDDLTAGDYLAVGFYALDARDAEVSHFTIGPSTRPVGGPLGLTPPPDLD